MGQQQSYTSVNSSTSCALDEDPEPIDPPSSFTLFSQQVEAFFCPCTLSEKIRRERNFLSHQLPLISTGDVFVLQTYNPPKSPDSGTVAKAKSGLLNFFSATSNALSSTPTTPSPASSTSSSAEIAKLKGNPVFLSVSLDLVLRFKMTANQNTTRGTLNLADIHHVRAIHEGLELCFSCVDSTGRDLVRFRATDSAMRDVWVAAISSLMVLYADEIQQTLGKNEIMERRSRRKIEITERRKKAKERIQEYQLDGMKHSAIARSKR